MKLEDISAETVRRAVSIYLRVAFPDEAVSRAPTPDLAGGAGATDLLPRFSDESERSGGRTIHRYVLRLGNSRYPHMKLALEESILNDEYVFGVDSHDDLNVSPEAPDYARWNALRRHNRLVAEEIEKEWREAGIPTLRTLQDLLDHVEPLTDARQRVLVVDDDPAVRETLRELLERAGLQVRTAADGREALQRVSEEAPNLILMDYQMPEMDGVACCEALKASPETRRIPVLLATRSQVDLSSLTFADGFLVKPYHQDVLFSLVRKLLS